MSEFLKACAVAASALLWTAAVVAWAARHGAFASVRRDWGACPRARRGLAAIALAAAVAWAGVKPGREETSDSHGFSRIEEDMPTALNAEDSEERRHGEEEEWVSTNQHESAQISIRDNSCQFVDKAPTGEETPCLPSSVSFVSSDSNPTPGYTLSRIGTNEVFSFAPPEGAVIAESWRRRGAATDWMRLSFGGWEFPFGDAAFSGLVVFADGTVLLSTNAALRPVAAALGLVPEANWPRISTNLHESVTIRDNPWLKTFSSLFWHALTPSNTLVLTWQNALLHRAPTNPVSFQVELSPNGNFAYRYDLSRLASDGLLTNVMGGVEAGEGKRKKEEGRSAEGQISFLLSRETTSLTFVSDSERRCGAARSAFDEALGGLDPLSFPPGSTNTVWEHLVYAGTTNGAFAYPQPTERTAMLRVSVTGAGRGELLVGNRAVPLVGERSATLNTCTEETQSVSEGTFAEGEPEGRASGREGMEGRSHGVVATDLHEFARIEGDVPTALNAEGLEGRRHGEAVEGTEEGAGSCTTTSSFKETPCHSSSISSVFSDSNSPTRNTPPPNVPTLLLPIPRGQTVPLYLRASGTLAVSFSSADFAFGRLPDLAAHRLTGRVNFPNASATVPCFHDYRARQREVTLPVGSDAAALTCTWTAPASVTVENVPPRSARLTGNFDGRTTPPVSYTLAHPDYLFGQTTYSQSARFCPPPPEEEEEDPSAGRHYGSRDGDEDDEDDPCWHCVWGLCGTGCDCCGNCRHSGAPETERPGGSSEEEKEPQPGDYETAATNWPHLTCVLKIREPLLYTDPIRLEVPGSGAPRCCPCPDHATNWVAVAYLSDRLKAVDADGLDFRRAAETVDVRLAGARPSRDVGDAFVSLATNGAVCLDGAYTVLGVGVRRPGVDLAALDALNADFGLPIPVATNAAEAAALELVTGVGLDGGNVCVGFEGASAPFALWAWSPGQNAYRPLASSDGGPLDVSLAAWRRLVGGATDAATARTAVSVTASAPGAATLVFRYWGVFGGRFVEDVARQRLTALAPRVRADVDHDGRLGASDDAARLAGRPFRFWFNEDCDKGDFVGQMSDATPNADDLKVNGKLDLVNLFPVEIDVSPFRRAWGRAANVQLRALSGDLRLCALGEGFSSERVLGLATAPVSAADGNPLESAALTPLGSGGLDLAELAGRPLTRPVALAFEAAGPVDAWSGPEVVVSLGGAEVYRERLPVSITSVDDLYRYADLRGAEAGGGFAPSVPGEPGNLPDGETDGRHFVFVHGYNVNESASRLWARAMFKRLWWAGSRSRFTAIDWRGDESQRYVPTQGDTSPNYYVNVRHAFLTAPALKALCDRLPGAKTMLAHSLGNMLVSAAAVDGGLPYDRYCMLNAAVPMEAYDEKAQDSLMVDGAWKGLDPRFRASHFADLFASATNDFRWALSWKGRFAGIRNAVNFYSPTEDVLANPTQVKVFGVESEDFGGAWSKQELFKGCALWYGVNAVLFSGAEIEGGWGINARCVANPLAYIPLSGFNAFYFEDYTREDLVTSPLFTSFKDERMASTNALAFSDAALRAKMLGDAIPAESFAAGRNETRGVSDNINLQDCASENWPRHDDEKDIDVWHHSDIKNVAFPFTFRLFKKIVNGKEVVDE